MDDGNPYRSPETPSEPQQPVSQMGERSVAVVFIVCLFAMMISYAALMFGHVIFGR